MILGDSDRFHRDVRRPFLAKNGPLYDLFSQNYFLPAEELRAEVSNWFKRDRPFLPSLNVQLYKKHDTMSIVSASNHKHQPNLKQGNIMNCLLVIIAVGLLIFFCGAGSFFYMILLAESESPIKNIISLVFVIVLILSVQKQCHSIAQVQAIMGIQGPASFM